MKWYSSFFQGCSRISFPGNKKGMILKLKCYSISGMFLYYIPMCTEYSRAIGMATKHLISNCFPVPIIPRGLSQGIKFLIHFWNGIPFHFSVIFPFSFPNMDWKKISALAERATLLEDTFFKSPFLALLNRYEKIK